MKALFTKVILLDKEEGIQKKVCVGMGFMGQASLLRRQ
jgi:hypothetical protein